MELPAPIGAKKFDGGKPDLSYMLEYYGLMAGFCRVMSHGEAKYGRENFMEGAGDEAYVRRLYAAVMRHLMARYGGEVLDPESGQDHLCHAMGGIAMIYQLTENGESEDERSNEE